MSKAKKTMFAIVAVLILSLASVSAFAGSNSGTINFPPYLGSYTTSVSGNTISGGAVVTNTAVVSEAYITLSVYGTGYKGNAVLGHYSGSRTTYNTNYCNVGAATAGLYGVTKVTGNAIVKGMTCPDITAN